MKKISSAQMTALLVCCLFTRLMTYIPRQDDNALLVIVSRAIVCALEFAVMLPAVVYFSKTQRGPLQNAFDTSAAVGKGVAVIYLLFCFYMLLMTFGNFAFYLQYSFSDYYAVWATLLTTAAAAVYTASMGIKSCGRTAAVVAFVTLIGIILVLIGFEGNIDLRDLHLAAENKGALVARGVRSMASRADEFVLLVILLPYLKGRPGKTVSVYILLKFVIASVITAAIAVILGEYAKISRLPFFALSSYSRTEIFERLDAFFLLFWTLCEVMTAAVVLICMNECIKLIFPSIHRIPFSAAAAAVCAAAAGIMIWSGIWKTRMFESFGFLPILITAGVIPLILLVFARKRPKERSAEKK